VYKNLSLPHREHPTFCYEANVQDITALYSENQLKQTNVGTFELFTDNHEEQTTSTAHKEITAVLYHWVLWD
jgi:hypothetical protein